MSQPTVPPEMSEDQVLAYTQSKRRHIVEKLTIDGKVPDEKTEVSLLISALDGMDRAALTNKRIKADEKASQGIAGAASVIAKLLTQVNSKGKSTDLEIISGAPLTLGTDIPAPDLVPGEIEITPGQMDFDSFTASFQNATNPSS
jgi:hypothetical protein